MLEILLKLPPGITNPKDNIVVRLGTIAFMLTTREINAAWNETKKKPQGFIPINMSWMGGMFFILMME